MHLKIPYNNARKWGRPGTKATPSLYPFSFHEMIFTLVYNTAIQFILFAQVLYIGARTSLL